MSRTHLPTPGIVLAAMLVAGGCGRDASPHNSRATPPEPDSEMAFCGRGEMWAKKGEYDKAISDFNEAIRLNPKSVFAYNDRGVVWKAKGEYDKAISDFSKAIQLDPKCVPAYNNRGLASKTKGGYDEAISDFNEAIRLDPKCRDPYNNLAWLLATCADAKYRDGMKAVEHATKTCELSDWRDHSTIDTLAASYAEADDFDEAMKWQEKALSVCSDDKKEEFQSRLELYKAGKPYHQNPAQSEARNGLR